MKKQDDLMKDKKEKSFYLFELGVQHARENSHLDAETYKKKAKQAKENLLKS